MKFKFAFQSLLEFRRQQEEVARRDYNESAVGLEREKALYKKYYTALHDAENASCEMKADKRSVDLAMLLELDRFMYGQKVKIAQQREVVINHTTITEGKQEILIAAAKETKILEKLEEKKLMEFKKMKQKKEAKQIDEVVVTRFKAGGRS